MVAGSRDASTLVSTLVKKTLEAHDDGWLYIKVVEITESEPVRRIYWWPTGLRVTHFRVLYGDEDIGKPVTAPIGALPHRYETTHSIVVNLKDGPQTRFTHFEQEDIPCPKLKGRQKDLPTRWIGYWQICTQKGWRAL